MANTDTQLRAQAPAAQPITHEHRVPWHKGGPPVTLAFQDALVSVVLQALADYQQLNLVVAAGVSGNISLRLVDVPWEQALTIILRMANLKVEREGAVMMVFTEQDIAERQQRAKQKRSRTL